MLWTSNSHNVYNCAVEKRVSKVLTDFSKVKYVKSYFPTADGCLKYTIEHMKWTLFNDMCGTKVCVSVRERVREREMEKCKYILSISNVKCFDICR